MPNVHTQVPGFSPQTLPSTKPTFEINVSTKGETQFLTTHPSLDASQYPFRENNNAHFQLSVIYTMTMITGILNIASCQSIQ